MTAPFTERSIKSLTPPERGQRDIFDTKLSGFGLRLSVTGSRSWFIWYRIGGRGRRFTLGPCALLTLDEARERARRLLQDVRDGKDPAAERKAQRQAAVQPAGDDSFSALADLYLEHVRETKRSWHKDERNVAMDVRPVLQGKRAQDVRPDDVEAIVERIKERRAPSQAIRTYGLIRRLYNWGLKRATVRLRFDLTTNPCLGVETPGRDRSRDRVLKPDEIRQVWQAFETEALATAALFKLGLLTAQRSGEVRTMRRDNLDFEAAWWTIPAERAKNGLAHRVPLSPPALAIIREVLATHSSPWVMPGNSSAGYRTATVHVMARLRKASGIADWRLHDLRRTAASHMAGTGVPRLVIGRILNHAEPGVTKVYDRHSYDPEKRQALEAWARKLESIVSGQALPKVVLLRA